jgi:hypothetical protein
MYDRYLITWHRLLMNTLKCRGPRTDPCGTYKRNLVGDKKRVYSAHRWMTTSKVTANPAYVIDSPCAWRLWV